MSENKPVLIALAVVGLIILGLAGYYFTSKPDQPDQITEPVDVKPIEIAVEPIPEPIPEPVEIQVEPPEAVQALIEPEPAKPAFVLPLLDNSDQLMRDGAVSLTRHEGINGWLSPNELIRRVVVFIDNVAAGGIARDPAGILAPQGAFSATQLGESSYLLDTNSYARYNGVANILISLDTKRAVEFYVLLKPLFDEAYGELGYPQADFDKVFQKAIAHLLETPILPQPVRLVRPVVMYEFENPDVERLSAAQKQLIRMGPKNTAAIQTKLRALAIELQSL